WSLNSKLGVVAERGAPPSGPPAQALHVRFLPSTLTGLAAQMLLLPPGAYRFTGQMMADDPVDDGQFAWSLACIDKTGAVLANVSPGAGPDRWRGFSTTFQVPPGCVAHRL